MSAPHSAAELRRDAVRAGEPPVACKGYSGSVDEPQQQRLALNEALFREVNERIREISDAFGQDDATHDFLCECSDPGCTKRVVLTRAEYEEVRSDPTRFVVAKGHAIAEIESVVERAKDHVVVEKEGAAADVAIHLDTPNG
jgi:hypothetical protein